MRAKQRDFFEKDRAVGPRRVAHGGSLAIGKRKVARPIDTKKPIHLVLKSSHAKSKLSMLSFGNRLNIEKILRTRAAEFGVVIQGYENMGNHLHVIAKFKSRAMFQNFLRIVTGLIARHVTGAKRGKPFGKRFFDQLAFTRVVNGLKDFRGLKVYLEKNEIERDVHPRARADFENAERDERLARRKRRKHPTP